MDQYIRMQVSYWPKIKENDIIALDGAMFLAHADLEQLLLAERGQNILAFFYPAPLVGRSDYVSRA